MKWLINGSPLRAQVEAMRRAEGRQGYNYWMDTGLGKTPLTLNDFANAYNEGWADYHVIITLNSFRLGIAKEAVKWGGPAPYAIWPLERNLNQSKYIGCIMNWEALAGSGGAALMEVLKTRKVYFHFDEAHKIKNPESAVTKAARGLWTERTGTVRRANTATPMAGKVMDLYVPLRLARALEGVNRFAFRNRFAEMGGFKGKQVIGIKKERRPELERLLDENAFRATKAEWSDLPPQVYMPVIRLDMPPKIQKHYREMLADFVTFVESIENPEVPSVVEAQMVISQISKLQQISSGFIKDAEGNNIPICDPSEVPKWQSVLDTYEMLQGRGKMIVFTNFVYSTEALAGFLEKKLGRPVARMRGATHCAPGETPEQQKTWFNSDDGPDLMVAMLQVGGTAHTMLGSTSQPCATTYFAETTYNYIDRVQAEGRNHREGQKFSVNYWDVASSPVEAAAVEAMQAKDDLVRSVIDRTRSKRLGL